MKKLISFIMILSLLFAAVFPTAAAASPSPKEEVVYGILGLDGNIKSIYVVNSFQGGKITDFGSYSDVRNMTTSERLDQNGDKISINTTADKFYYQGTLKSRKLPWLISIKYFLDGREINGEDLAGKSGKLRIDLSVSKNPTMDTAFFDNYALQITLTLDSRLCTTITSDNATIAEAGGKKQLNYTVLPGNGLDTQIEADVRNFKMDAISINGIRLALDIAVDSKEFTSKITELVDAVKGLDDGAGELLQGVNELSAGMQKYITGMKPFKDGLVQLSNNTEKLSTGAAAVNNGISELVRQNPSLINGALAIQQATFDSINAQLSGMGLGLPVLTPENYNKVLSPIPNLAAVKKQLDGAVQFTQGLKSYMEGVAQLGEGASGLAAGTAEFKASAAVLAASANGLYNAGVELNKGVKKLRDGLASYKDGTKKLREGTRDIRSKIDTAVHELLGSVSGKGGKVISFVSGKNTNVSAIQFVLKTAPIELPGDQKHAPPKPEKLNFWQKLLKLFGLYKD